MATKTFKIKNYTSNVSVSKSISGIEHLLAQAGADTIVKQYVDADDGTRKVDGFTFSIKDGGEIAVFYLPSKITEYSNAMLAEKKRLRKGTKALVLEQAERTAWRVLHEWVAIQLTMIRVHRIHPFQIFLGYLYDPRSKEGYFQKLMRDGGMRLLGTADGK